MLRYIKTSLSNTLFWIMLFPYFHTSVSDESGSGVCMWTSARNTCCPHSANCTHKTRVNSKLVTCFRLSSNFRTKIKGNLSSLRHIPVIFICGSKSFFGCHKRLSQESVKSKFGELVVLPQSAARWYSLPARSFFVVISAIFFNVFWGVFFCFFWVWVSVYLE